MEEEKKIITKMTDFEICKSYREAKNPTGQLKILAELNACSIVDIEEILKRNNEPMRKRQYKKPAKKETKKPANKGILPDIISDAIIREYDKVSRELEVKKAEVEELNAELAVITEWLSNHGIKT